MEKYKICPSCKTKNEPTFLECLNCEADLTRVKITDEETEKMLKANEAEEPNSQTSSVRVCECGVKNPPNARKCRICYEDISDITPTPDTVDQGKTLFVLSSLDGQYVFKMTSNEITIGRESAMNEYLSTKSYVSRAHAKLYLEAEQLYIENLSNTNFTYINNKKITGKVKLEDGSEIGLGGTNVSGKSQADAAYFLVRIDQCM